ncbi:MAG: DUF998 domain-containing protein [Desulfurococcaceae archaeon]
MGKYRIPCVTMALLSITLPLAMIAVSILMSPWFNIYNNALSDLGHAVRRSSAPVFNLGLATGGFLVSIFASKYLVITSKTLGIAASISGYLLMLVGLYDQVYNMHGKLHYYASVAFFLSLACLLLIYAAVIKDKLRKTLAITSLIVAVITWYLHLELGIPRGAAIPELVSIFAVIPFYMDLVLRQTCREM